MVDEIHVIQSQYRKNETQNKQTKTKDTENKHQKGTIDKNPQ